MSEIYDIAILGGGPAGYIAAIRAAQLGAGVVLVEKNALGGVCMNVGCIPTKALLKSAHLNREFNNAKDHGIDAALSGTNWGSAVLRKDRIVKMLGKGVQHLMKANNITVINGEGTVASQNEISVVLSDNSQKITINYKKLIIATGSLPLVPSFIKGCELEGVLTSTTALSLCDIPQHIVIIGGGVIGLEFAEMYSSLGAAVTVLELSAQILPNEDEEISAELLKLLKRRGIKFVLGAKVTHIEKAESELCVYYNIENSEEAQSYICNNVLLAVGRTLNSNVVSALNLNTENGKIIVDENMQTSQPDVYAAGDVTGVRLLAHFAFAQGRIAAESAIGKAGASIKIDLDTVPACVYTSPEVASVGMNEKTARERGINFKIGRSDFRVNGRSLTLAERDGFVKIIADENSIIIGAQILGENASELISELTLAIALKAGAHTLANIIHPHPSLSEAVWEACNKIAGTPVHS